MLQEINMIGGGFQHEICSSAGYSPKLIKWVKNGTAPISIHIDYSIINIPIDKNKKNYAWLVESKTISIGLYEWCENNILYLEKNFELIFTHDVKLTKLSNKIKLVVCNAKPLIKIPGIYNKSKLLSMVASNKVMCEEHRYRQEIIKKYKNKLNLFGRGYNEINDKSIGLNDYYFSIAMENHTYPLAYSEKLIDCFVTGTIPIYYGSELIGDIFNSDGIIMLTDNFNIEDLSIELYYSKMDAIKDNYNKAINLPIAEDYIYEKYIK